MKAQVPEWAHVKYFHERHWASQWSSTEDRYVYVPASKGGYTEARVFNDKGELVAMGIAECSNHDNFNKRIGRDIALGRALKNFKGGLLPGDKPDET